MTLTFRDSHVIPYQKLERSEIVINPMKICDSNPGIRRRMVASSAIFILYLIICCKKLYLCIFLKVSVVNSSLFAIILI